MADVGGGETNIFVGEYLCISRCRFDLVQMNFYGRFLIHFFVPLVNCFVKYVALLTSQSFDQPGKPLYGILVLLSEKIYDKGDRFRACSYFFSF